MKILGVSTSPRQGQSTDQLVQAVLAGAEGVETEFVSLAGRNINACVACLGCVEDNICVVKDGMEELRPKLIEADAFVIGGANYFNSLNGLGRCFLERWYQFRHREARGIAGKLGVALGVGGSNGDRVVSDIQTCFQYNQIECVAGISAQGVAGCFTCGYGENCNVGAIHNMYGPGAKITPENTPSLAKQPDVLEAARAAGAKLAERLKARA